MSYSGKIQSVSKRMENNSIMIVFSSEPQIRNRDVLYKFRNNSDLLYLTGFNFPDMIFCTDSDGRISIFMKFPDPDIERWQGKMTEPAHVASQLNISENQIFQYNTFSDRLPDLLKDKKNLYIDYNLKPETLNKIITTINSLNKNTRDKTFGPQNIINSGYLLHEARIFKSNEEIKKIQQAIDITSNSFIETIRWTRNNISEGIYEYHIKSKIEQTFQFYGSDDLAYPTIVASGNNANYLHYEKCTERINAHDLILVDAGCEWDSYASDITRTFPANGKFNDYQKALYEISLSAQKNSIELCKTGTSFENLHNKAVETIVTGLWELGLFKKIFDVNSKDKKLFTPGSKEEILEKKYYRLFYMHYTSHYLGLDVHDVGCYYENNNSRKISNGMVFTVEPGIYIHKDYDFLPENYRGIGIRIEDDIFITNENPVILCSNIPKEVYEIEGLI